MKIEYNFNQTNAEILSGFKRTVFGENIESARIRKFEDPIRIGIIGDEVQKYHEMVAWHAAQLRDLTKFDIEVVKTGDANVIMIFTGSIVEDVLGKYRKISKNFYSDESSMEQSVRRFSKDTLCYRSIKQTEKFIVGSLIVIPSDKEIATKNFCTMQKLSEAIGLYGRDTSVQFSIFNASKNFISLTDQDKIFFRLFSDSRMAPGTPGTEALALGKKILAELRPNR